MAGVLIQLRATVWGNSESFSKINGSISDANAIFKSSCVYDKENKKDFSASRHHPTNVPAVCSALHGSEDWSGFSGEASENANEPSHPVPGLLTFLSGRLHGKVMAKQVSGAPGQWVAPKWSCAKRTKQTLSIASRYTVPLPWKKP